jgi:hypothetical protein
MTAMKLKQDPHQDEIRHDQNHSFDEEEVFIEEGNLPELKSKITLSWHNVNITADIIHKKGPCRKEITKKTIIDNVSGCVQPG